MGGDGAGNFRMGGMRSKEEGGDEKEEVKAIRWRERECI